MDCEKASAELKMKLTTPPILAFPDFSKPFILDTDASNLSIGAALSQLHEGKERVVYYDSRLLKQGGEELLCHQERTFGSCRIHQ